MAGEEEKRIKYAGKNARIQNVQTYDRAWINLQKRKIWLNKKNGRYVPSVYIINSTFKTKEVQP